jgi:hypothetical protein
MTPRGFFLDYLAFDIEREIEPADWLTFPEQKLRTISSGGVFHDEVGLEELRQRFSYYPRDVWLYQLGSAWARVGQEEHLMGRAGMVGDEIGSALIGARLVRDLMRLCFLMERTYAPYPKWFGTAFKQLSCAEALSPHLSAALAADMAGARAASGRGLPTRRGDAQHSASQTLSRLSRATSSAAPSASSSCTASRTRLFSQIVDERVRRIAARYPIGGIDLFSDSTDLLQHATWRATLRKLLRVVLKLP